MLKEDITMCKVYNDLSQRSFTNHFMQVTNYLDDNNLIRCGDVHASNIKLNPNTLHHNIQDDTEQEQ